jgi:MazG family protein
MQGDNGFGAILELVRDLRRRCDFDRALTLDTLRPYLREEIAEFEDALEAGREDKIASELGDIMLHCAFQLVLAEERGAFDLAQVSQRLVQKMKDRHPHLYAESGEQRDERNDARPKPDWEKQKLAERRREAAAHGEPPSVLGHISNRLPELERALRYQERAAAVGFDWPDVAGPLEKLDEEVREARAYPRDEIGDVLFAAVNVARKAGMHPAIALRHATLKFVRRFGAVEQLAVARGVELGAAPLDALDRLWDEVKAAEHA